LSVAAHPSVDLPALTVDPASGALAASDSTVTVDVSQGLELVAVPSVVGQPIEQVEARIRDAGLLADVHNFGTSTHRNA